MSLVRRVAAVPRSFLVALPMGALMRERRPVLFRALVAALATILGAACEETVAPPALGEVLTVAVDTTAMPLVRRVTVVMRAAGPATVTWGATGTPVLALTADSAAFVHQFLVPRLRQGRSYVVEASAPGSTRAPVRATFATDSLPPVVRAIRINRTGTPSLPVALVEVVGATQFAGLLMIEEGEIAGWLPLVGALCGALPAWLAPPVDVGEPASVARDVALAP